MSRSRNWKRRRHETSKALLIFSDALAVAAAVASIAAVFILNDPSPLGYLIPAVFGLAATSHGFYYWKAKNENMAKHGRNIKEEEDGEV